MTNLNLPEHWEKLSMHTCDFQIKQSSLITVSRFQIFTDEYCEFLYVHNTMTLETWVCDTYLNDIQPDIELLEVKKTIEKYLEQGYQLNLFDS